DCLGACCGATCGGAWPGSACAGCLLCCALGASGKFVLGTGSSGPCAGSGTTFPPLGRCCVCAGGVCCCDAGKLFAVCANASGAPLRASAKSSAIVRQIDLLGEFIIRLQGI